MVLDLKLVGSSYSIVILQINSLRYLGMYLNNHFSWQDHVDYLCSHLQQRLYCTPCIGSMCLMSITQSEIMFLFIVLESILWYACWHGSVISHEGDGEV